MHKLLDTVLTFITGIKWTPLKISVIGNVLLVLLILFLYKGNEIPEPQIIIKEKIITIPGKAGKLDTIYEPKYISKTNPVNTDLLKKYNTLKLKDSIVKDSMFIEAITERDYNESYEDSLVKIDIYTKVQGKLLKQAPKYEIKPYSIQIKDTTTINYNKPPTNKILVGLETGLPLTLFTKKDVIDIKPVIKGSIYFQNKKTNVITAGFDTNKTIWAGYLIKL